MGWPRRAPRAASSDARDWATSSGAWAAARPPTSYWTEVAREARLVTDDMATVVLTPTAGVTAGGFRSEQLEVDASEDASDDLVRKFLAACGVAAVDSGPLVAEVHELVDVHGGAVVHVEYGISRPRVEVLPRNVESIEAASRRLVRATG